jgi:N-acetylglucosaminyldiphosphoundecaprenol N-acetyl-beta-D-mannosaminyltransferase
VKWANFAGVRIDAVTYADMFAKVDAWLKDKTTRSHHIGCINAYCVSLALEDPALARIYDRADIAGPDGMPFVFWIRAFVSRACDRFYAPDVVSQLAEHARTTGYTFYLYGGSPDMAEGTRRFLLERFPHLAIVGVRSPPFRPLTAEEDAAIVDEINALAPDIVCVGLGTPMQDYWIDQHIERIRGSVLIACGATFDFFGGRIRMAPRFVQRSGFEWLYRLATPDFPRLWRRYTIQNAKFLSAFAQQLVGLRRRVPANDRRS